MPAAPARTVTEYDSAMRERADEKGAPIPRMSQPVAGATPGTFLFARNGVPHLMDTAGPAAGIPRPFNDADAMTILGGTEETTVWAVNRTVVTKASTIANRIPATDQRPDPVAAMRRRFTHLIRAERTARLVVIPELIHEKYWAPTSLAGAPVKPWASALNLPAPDARDPLPFFTALAAVLLDGTSRTIGRSSPLSFITTSERAVMKAAEWGGMAFQATQLAAAEAADDAWTAMQRLDPLLTERNLLTGLCSAGRPRRDDPALVRVTGQARLRVDDDLLITDIQPDDDRFRHGFARLAGYRMIDGDLHAQVEPVEQTDRRRANTVDTSGVALLAGLAANGGTALLSAKPYLRSASKAYFGPRWSAGRVPTERRVTRDVPLDVLLAGA
ncbi:hypothetical protein [Nakamurella multipartita]|uniref:Uncharacterized protein n=1 Tax=Nakamurella multipartita (strain ATCC 700099 / DSM 44233 / CIP 104796 / JCM 9543 / NBRC 105858 / Y-104) TaxID=479431 RepID=C8X8G3_NAKMY|nr:hypothetical protein [Nakamurella multipartita]ACV79018.1 hypothetical protein Namu_2672 [Nakamurella multipartita DSM 44233]